MLRNELNVKKLIIMQASITVSMSRDLLEAILESARRLHPRETILLLRGKRRKNLIEISDFLIPPFATYGQGFSALQLHMLPIDFSIVGMAHSHPSGALIPSSADLNNFFGIIFMIVGFPFLGEKNVAVYSRNGEKVPLLLTE
jgi:proteasome lid subunit RPN8/RPN11